ncbi:MAG: PAS domain-containing sensor histidine kinase, partial [Leptothrix sp. (in: b-proteobacteria)]
MSCTDQFAAHATSQALRHNEDQWRELFTQGSDAIFVADLDGRYTDVNEAGCQLLGYRRDELVGKTIVDLIDARDVARLAQSKARLLDGGVLVSEWALRHRDGHFVPVEVRARILSDGRWVGFIRDVIAHKRALDQMQDAAAELERRVAQRTEQLQRLVADLEMTEIRERRQIARDLHDDLSQTLAAVNIRLAALRDHACAEVRHTVGSVDRLLDSAHRAIRSLAARLTPALLDEHGLVPALSWLGDEIERQFGLRVQVDDDGEAKPLSQEARSIVYRATRELLINAAKHARIDHVRVECLRDGEQVRVQVSDRGVGFDPARLLAANAAASATTAADRRGFGLVSLHERMAFIGGSARVISRPGHGTRVVLRAPLS